MVAATGQMGQHANERNFDIAMQHLQAAPFVVEARCRSWKAPTWQFFVTFSGWLSDPFQWLSDLQLGDEKVTLNHLADAPNTCELVFV